MGATPYVAVCDCYNDDVLTRKVIVPPSFEPTHRFTARQSHDQALLDP